MLNPSKLIESLLYIKIELIERNMWPDDDTATTSNSSESHFDRPLQSVFNEPGTMETLISFFVN